MAPTHDRLWTRALSLHIHGHVSIFFVNKRTFLTTANGISLTLISKAPMRVPSSNQYFQQILWPNLQSIVVNGCYLLPTCDLRCVSLIASIEHGLFLCWYLLICIWVYCLCFFFFLQCANCREKKHSLTILLFNGNISETILTTAKKGLVAFSKGILITLFPGSRSTIHKLLSAHSAPLFITMISVSEHFLFYFTNVTVSAGSDDFSA